MQTVSSFHGILGSPADTLLLPSANPDAHVAAPDLLSRCPDLGDNGFRDVIRGESHEAWAMSPVVVPGQFAPAP